MRSSLLITLGLTGLALTACATGPAPVRSYSLGEGVVAYDDLKRAGEKCQSEGGTIRAKQDGGDPAQLSNYSCVIPPSGK
ncbi:hypothetical protein [Caulobacter sp.]|jgi:hypothetical protein|uniref:hypothetical protein n=1 Tax=Caulobacter sp. TaxID=78 RepID=UPI001610EBC9